MNALEIVGSYILLIFSFSLLRIMAFKYLNVIPKLLVIFLASATFIRNITPEWTLVFCLTPLFITLHFLVDLFPRNLFYFLE